VYPGSGPAPGRFVGSPCCRNSLFRPPLPVISFHCSLLFGDETFLGMFRTVPCSAIPPFRIAWSFSLGAFFYRFLIRASRLFFSPQLFPFLRSSSCIGLFFFPDDRSDFDSGPLNSDFPFPRGRTSPENGLSPVFRNAVLVLSISRFASVFFSFFFLSKTPDSARLHLSPPLRSFASSREAGIAERICFLPYTFLWQCSVFNLAVLSIGLVDDLSPKMDSFRFPSAG